MLALALAILGAVGTVVATVAYLDARSNRKVKRLVWQATAGIPLAAASSAESDYKLSILYERPGARPQVVKSADATYVRFANLGKEPIRKDDIAPASAFRLEVQSNADGTGIPLDASLVASSRAIIRLSLGELEHSGETASAAIDFDFLDHQDGGLLRLLSNGPPLEVRLVGDIVGMPEGLQEWNGLDGAPTEVKGWGIVGWAVLELVGFGALAALFRNVTGGWTGVWLLVLPPVVFIVVLVLCMIAAEGPSAYKRRRVRFPRSLELPRHVGMITMMGPSGEYMIPSRPRPPDGRHQLAEPTDSSK